MIAELHRDWDDDAAAPAEVVPSDCDYDSDCRYGFAAGFGCDCAWLVAHWIGYDCCDCDCVV